MNNLVIQRLRDDIDFFEIGVEAQSEYVKARTSTYTTTTKIDELALRLETYPVNTEDKFIWENGGKGDDYTPYVSLEFSYENDGTILIEVYLEVDDGASLSKHNCCFYVKTEAGSLNVFGKSLRYINEKGTGRKAVLNHSCRDFE